MTREKGREGGWYNTNDILPFLFNSSDTGRPSSHTWAEIFNIYRYSIVMWYRLRPNRCHYAHGNSYYLALRGRCLRDRAVDRLPSTVYRILFIMFYD